MASGRPPEAVSGVFGIFQCFSTLFSSVFMLPKSVRNCLERSCGWLKASWWPAVGGLAPPYPLPARQVRRRARPHAS
eukprot:3912327-Alexandrium_andersonii.AAC.1